MKADAQEAAHKYAMLYPNNRRIVIEDAHLAGWNACADAAAERAYDFILHKFGTREMAVKVQADLLALKGER